jgi:hypothetical protein
VAKVAIAIVAVNASMLRLKLVAASVAVLKAAEHAIDDIALTMDVDPDYMDISDIGISIMYILGSIKCCRIGSTTHF